MQVKLAAQLHNCICQPALQHDHQQPGPAWSTRHTIAGRTWNNMVLCSRVGTIPQVSAKLLFVHIGERSPGHTVFPNQEQDPAGMPLQMAGPDAKLSLAASMGVLDRSSCSFWQRLVFFLSLLPLFQLATCTICCARGQHYVQVSNWAADNEGMMQPYAGSGLLAMYVMLSHSSLSTLRLSLIQPSFTWHRVDGLWVYTFEDH